MPLNNRPYQDDMESVFFDNIDRKRYFLIQGPCASGKTIVFSNIVKRYRAMFPSRKIAIITRIGTLVTQAYDKLMGQFPLAVFGQIGIASKKISNRVEVNLPITIATIQTLVNNQPSVPYDLIIIDEVHQLNTRNRKSQIKEFLEAQEKANPKLQVIGFTATPYRLTSGFIYGDNCTPGTVNWFGDLDYQITMAELQKQEYLVPFQAKEIVNIESELTGIETNSTGDYKTNQLSGKMQESRHVESAVNAISKYAQGRKNIAVFCVDIAHAERVKKAFNNAGYVAETVHSKKKEDENVKTIKSFESGRFRLLVSVESLTTGFDSTCIDCICFLRPTKSPSLYVQMLGRGLRLFPGKRDCLMLDMAALFRTHGNPNDPTIIVPSKTKAEREKEDQICRECKSGQFDEEYRKIICVNSRSHAFRNFVAEGYTCSHFIKKPKIRVCGVCGAIQPRPYKVNFCVQCLTPFPIQKKEAPKFNEDNKAYELSDVNFKNKSLMVIVNKKALKMHTSRAGNTGLLLKMSCVGNGGSKIYVNEFMDLTGSTGARAKARGQSLFIKILGQYPVNNDSALELRKQFLNSIPARVGVTQSNGYWRLDLK